MYAANIFISKTREIIAKRISGQQKQPGSFILQAGPLSRWYHVAVSICRIYNRALLFHIFGGLSIWTSIWTSIIDRHRCHMAATFGVFVDEDHSKLPTLYWLPKLHKRHYKSHFIANYSSCTTTELSILLTSYLTAIKNHIIKYCTTVYERNGKNLFWSIKNSGEILNKLKSRGFLASGLSTYDFSTLYTTLPQT